MSLRPVVAIVALVALAMALPAAARAPVGTATVDLQHDGGCRVTVSYSWNDFKGRDLTAYYGAVRSLGGGAELWLFVSVSAEGSGAASHTFDLTGRGSDTYYGGGRLIDARGRVLGGSDVRSATSVALDCL